MSSRETERHNIQEYFTVFLYFALIFIVILFTVLILKDISSSYQEENEENIESNIQLDSQIVQDSNIEKIIHVPGYKGDFVVLKDAECSKPFSLIEVGYFTDTKVMYSISNYGTLTLLVNEDGTPVTYSEDTD